MTGWNMPPGVTESMIPGCYDAPPLDRCECCGCWLTFNPDRSEVQYLTGNCTGAAKVAGDFYPCYGSEAETDGPHEPHTWQEYNGINEYRVCRHCGAENVMGAF